MLQVGVSVGLAVACAIVSLTLFVHLVAIAAH